MLHRFITTAVYFQISSRLPLKLKTFVGTYVLPPVQSTLITLTWCTPRWFANLRCFRSCWANLLRILDLHKNAFAQFFPSLSPAHVHDTHLFIITRLRHVDHAVWFKILDLKMNLITVNGYTAWTEIIRIFAYLWICMPF